MEALLAPSLAELDKKVAVIEVELDQVKNDVGSIKSDMKRVVWLVLAAVIIAVLNFTIPGGAGTIAHAVTSAATHE